MKLLNTKKKLCVVKTPGTLADLNYILGPILRPTKIDLTKVANMVNKGIAVFEVNPADHSEMIRLTSKNVKQDNFESTTKEVKQAVVTNVEQPKEEPPVVIEQPVEEIIEEIIEEVVEEKKEEAPKQEKHNHKHGKNKGNGQSDFQKK